MSDSITQYRFVPDFPGYRVGDDASIWSNKGSGNWNKSEVDGEWRRLSVKRHNNSHTPYYIVTLCCVGKYKTFLLHRLIALCFFGPPPFPGAKVLHRDDNPENNTPGNLRWGTHAENMQDAVRNGKTSRGSNNRHAKLTEEEVREIKRLRAEEGLGCRKLAKRFKVIPATIQLILSGVNWKHVICDSPNTMTQSDIMKGVRNPAAKVTEDQVREIRDLYASGGKSQREIGEQFNLTQSMVSGIILRKSWSHVE